MGNYTRTTPDGETVDMTDIKIGGVKVGVPVQALTDDALRKKITAHFTSSPAFRAEFDKLIDKETGSPANVRMLVGSAPEKDKLKAPRRFFPGSPYR